MSQSKFIADCEMTTLGSIYHDFPRLAKQSGFYFQLHTGRVNWMEIENLNLDEIIQKRNYELLERNLINVINCNLEREYDLKILEPNFVKLFKLAQLGIDYLSYCEMYLDRCAVLLQEQLTAFQEEYETLKQESQKMNEEKTKSKRKNKTQNYQCEKCEKVFISDVYLKFHDKRRHSSPNTPIILDTSQKKYIDNSQQTEDGRKLSISTQTLSLEMTNPPECEDRGILKKNHTIKIEKLEQELKDLKERLKKAESSLTEKVENSQLNQSNVLHPHNVAGPVCCNSWLMLLPSYLKKPGSGYCEINPGCQIPVPEVPQSPVDSGTKETKPQLEEKSQSNTLRKTFGKELPNKENKPNIEITELGKRCGNELSKEENRALIEGAESYPECHNEEYLNYNKENVDPNSKKCNLIKPLPPPRKLKKGIRPQSLSPDKMPLKAFTTDKEEIYKEEGTEDFNSRSIVHRSTPIKGKPHDEITWEILEASRENRSGINKPKSNSTESLNSRKSISTDHESKSLIKKIVGKNSPKLRRFSKNLKRSLTNLYDSVSSTEKNSKKRESEPNLKASVVNGLNNRLKELGVDPQWQGIPKKTMKQKLNILKHRRKLLSKENPMFPIIRQNIEEKIFHKIKNNMGNKKSFMNKLSKQGSMIVEDPAQQISFKDKSDFMRVKKSIMYDTDTDSESKVSESESNFSHVPDQSTSQKNVVVEELTSFDEEEKVEAKGTKEFDFSVFQVSGGSLNSLTEGARQKSVSFNKKDFFTESDSEDNFVDHSEEKIFKTLNSSLSNTDRDENCESPKNYGKTEKHLESSNAKVECHGILKEEGLQSKLSMTAKKRVLFANYVHATDEELSDSPVDDLWPFKSDSEKDNT